MDLSFEALRSQGTDLAFMAGIRASKLDYDKILDVGEEEGEGVFVMVSRPQRTR